MKSPLLAEIESRTTGEYVDIIREFVHEHGYDRAAMEAGWRLLDRVATLQAELDRLRAHVPTAMLRSLARDPKADLRSVVRAFDDAGLVPTVTVYRAKKGKLTIGGVVVPASEAFGPAPKPGGVEYAPTKKRAAAMKIQGQYLGHLRMLNREARAAVKNFARLDGVRVALAWAKFYRGLGPKPVTRERKYGQPTWKQKQAAIRKATSRAVRKATPTVMDAKLVRGKWAVKVKSEGTAFALAR